jgi:hypothetical protein
MYSGKKGQKGIDTNARKERDESKKRQEYSGIKPKENYDRRHQKRDRSLKMNQLAERTHEPLCQKELKEKKQEFKSKPINNDIFPGNQ